MNEKSLGDEKTVADPGIRSGSSFPPGHILGQYRLIRLLGRGGMGEVYEAEHSTLGLRYALKLLPPDFASRSGALERFRKEARVMAQLQHPNIVRVDDFGEVSGRYWLRMELMSGLGEDVISLADLAKRGSGKVEQKQLLGILKQVVDGLGYAHSRGAVHRDLKPGNILLEKDDQGGIRTKVADFGLVRLVGEEWFRSQAQISIQRSLSLGEKSTEADNEGASTKALLGTYEYMSPEQKRGEEADERSDIYSLGLIAYRLLAGQELGMSTPSQIDSVIVKSWDEPVRAALEPNREKRIGDCQSLAGLLAKVDVEIARMEREAEEKRLRVEEEKRRQEAEKKRRQEAEKKRRREEVEKRRKEAEERRRRAEEEAVRRDREGRERQELLARQELEAVENRAAQASRRYSAQDIAFDLGGGVKLEMVWIKPGDFIMGSPPDEDGHIDDESPRHPVQISRGFWMGKYPVTQEQYQRLKGVNPSHFRGEKLPVERVSWFDAKGFCEKLNDLRPFGLLEGYLFRLPTEAEWEYACRAGTTTPFNCGETISTDQANYDGSSGGNGTYREKTTSVDTFPANAWGLHDMHGNVCEWCWDWYDTGYYAKSPSRDPTGSADGSSRVLRGGSWFEISRYLRSAFRDVDLPGNTSCSTGFRVVLAGSAKWSGQ